MKPEIGYALGLSEFVIEARRSGASVIPSAALETVSRFGSMNALPFAF